MLLTQPYLRGISGINQLIGLIGKNGTKINSGSTLTSTKRELFILELFHAMLLHPMLQIKQFLLLLFLLLAAHLPLLQLVLNVMLPIHRISIMTKKWAVTGFITKIRNLSNASSKTVNGSSIHLHAVGLV